MTGRICVRKREKWRVLCNVNAARGGRGLQTAASSPGSAQEQIASAATSPRLCSGLMNQVTWALLFWARPAPRPPPPPCPRNWRPAHPRVRFPTRARRTAPAPNVLNPWTLSRSSGRPCLGTLRTAVRCCPEPRPRPRPTPAPDARLPVCACPPLVVTRSAKGVRFPTPSSPLETTPNPLETGDLGQCPLVVQGQRATMPVQSSCSLGI